MRLGRFAKHFLRDSSGATAVEFALVIGPLVLLLVATIEVGRMMWAGHALDEVAIEGARCMGILAPDCASDEVIRPELVTAHIVQMARSWGIAVSPQDIELDTNAGCAVDTGFLRIALSLRFNSVLPGLRGTMLNSEACFPLQL